MVAFLLVAFWMTSGGLSCSLLAARKGHDETDWLLLGAALGPIALFMLWRAPHLRPISYLVSNPRLPALIVCPSCRSVVALHPTCRLCEEPLPGATRPESPAPRRRPRLPR